MASKRSDAFDLVILGVAFALAYFLHLLFDLFFEEWIKAQLQDRFGPNMGELIEKLNSAFIPGLATVGVICFLFHYIKRGLRRELEGRSLEIVYDANDLRILGQQTVDFPNILVLDGAFSRRLIKPYFSHVDSPLGLTKIYQGGALDPHVLELVNLCELPNERKFISLKGTDDPLAGRQTFVVEARGRNLTPITSRFEYDPNRYPMIRKLAQ
jgi:hypothetical protein